MDGAGDGGAARERRKQLTAAGAVNHKRQLAQMVCLAPGRFPSSAAPASSRGPGEGGGSVPLGPGLGCVVVSMRSMTPLACTTRQKGVPLGALVEVNPVQEP